MTSSVPVLSDRRLSRRVQQLCFVVGGITWIPARWGVLTTWDTTWLGAGYVGWNRLTLVPLTLLAAGSLWAARDGAPRGVRASWGVVAAGFVAAWLGVVLEFVVGGGLRGGPRELAMAGWTTYVIGTMLAGLGAAAAAVVVGRDRARPGRLAAALPLGVAGLGMVAWPFLLFIASPEAAVVDQLVVGAAWAVVGVTAVRPASTARAVAGGELSSVADDVGHRSRP